MNRLEEEYSNVEFEYVNALDGGLGQKAFNQLGLRGHPAILIYNAEGVEILRIFSAMEESLIIEVLDGFEE